MKGEMAELTGLEPATSAVTGQRSNQLSYSSVPVYGFTSDETKEFRLVSR